MEVQRSKKMKKRICVGLLAHVDAGKTTLAESMLYKTGVIRAPGRVDHQDTFLDNYELERARGITIFSKQAQMALGDFQATLMDTPGHVDFSAEMERTLQALDYAVLVISGADGVQSHVETLWRLLKRYSIPVFLFINKMDQPGTDRKALMRELTKRLDGRCVDFTAISGVLGATAVMDSRPGTAFQAGKRMPEASSLPGKWTEEQRRSEEEALRENLAVCDEALLERYLENGEIPEPEIVRLIAERRVFPCYFGSALKLWGVDELLEGIRRFAAAPEYPEEFGARVFKITRDEQGARLTHMKITGGSLKVKTILTNRREMPETQKKPVYGQDEKKEAGGGIWEEKADQIRVYSGGSYEAETEIWAGTVCAVAGLTRTYAGQGLGIESGAELPLLEPVLSCRIALPPEWDVYSAFLQLRQLEEEEPELHILWDEQAGEIRAQLMGEVQTEILKSIIKKRFGMDVEFETGSIVYKETIENTVEGVGHFEPLRHYAEVHLLMEPGERGSGLQFAARCSEDMLDGNWQRLILTHLEEKQHRGVLTGAEITDMKITLVAGRAHQKHTEGGDFRQAACRAVRHGLRCARSILLEPVYEFRMELPARCAGRGMADIQKMCGSFEPLIIEGDTAILCGQAPVAGMRGYQTELLSYTKGRGRLSCILKGYEECHNAREVIDAKGYDPEADPDNPTGSVFCSHGAGFVVPWNQVREYMHVDSGLGLTQEQTEEPEAAPAPTRYNGSFATGPVDEKELQAIFERTYGAPAAQRKGYAKSRRVEAAPTGNAKPKEPREEFLLVDGYNIIFAWEELNGLAKTSIEAARDKLMDIMCNYQGYKKVRLILVFDAYKVPGGRGGVFRYHNIHVVYTKEAETADQYIEKTVRTIGRKYHVTVATSDAMEQIIILGAGAERLSARDFHEELEEMKQELRENYLNRQQDDKNYLFDRLDDATGQIMEEVRLGRRDFSDP